MAGKKWYSTVEIASKLTRANDLAAQGKLQSEIASTLGVSVMPSPSWVRAQSSGTRSLTTAKKYKCADS